MPKVSFSILKEVENIESIVDYKEDTNDLYIKFNKEYFYFAKKGQNDVYSLNFDWSFVVDKNNKISNNVFEIIELTGMTNFFLKNNLINDFEKKKEFIEGKIYIEADEHHNIFLNKEESLLWENSVVSIQENNHKFFCLNHKIENFILDKRIKISKNLFIDLDKDNNYCALWYFGGLPENLLEKIK